MADRDIVLRAAGISKAYGGTRALDGVDFGARAGRVHALLGGNGSGKSTLIKILAGVEHADAGRVELGGAAHDARALSPAIARRGGLHVVHQHASTFGAMSVTENLALGRGYDCDAAGRIRWRRSRRRAATVLRRFEIAARPDDRLDTLRPALQTMVAIARALQDQEDSRDGVLILDEPTASLPTAEVDELFAALRRYAAAGQAIVFVTHRLPEVLDLADDVTVLRDGRAVAQEPRAQLDHDALVELIAGRALPARQPRRGDTPAVRRGAPLLTAEGLRGGAVRHADVTLHEHEIVGVAGLLGSGRTTLLRLLFGLQPAEAGVVTLDGRELRAATPRDAMRAGLAYVPEDRAADAAFPSLTIRENLSIARLDRYWHRGRVDGRREARDARAAMDEFLVRARSDAQALAELSGGNQQKVVMARWLRREPRVLLLDEPSQGVDVGARADIHAAIRTAVAGGAAALLVSSDIEELAAYCDRVVVLAAGRTTRVLDGPGLSAEQIEHAVLDDEGAST